MLSTTHARGCIQNTLLTEHLLIISLSELYSLAMPKRRRRSKPKKKKKTNVTAPYNHALPFPCPSEHVLSTIVPCGLATSPIVHRYPHSTNGNSTEPFNFDGTISDGRVALLYAARLSRFLHELDFLNSLHKYLQQSLNIYTQPWTRDFNACVVGNNILKNFNCLK